MNSERFGIPPISLRHLKSALAVFQQRNVTKAAVELNRSQTAVTKAINELEGVIHARLFDRSSTGMMPTAHGEALAHRTALAVAEFRSAGLAYEEMTGTRRAAAVNPIFTFDISYKRLAAFVALYETRDIGAASSQLGVTKAAVYNSVRKLEELLETELFEREPSGVSPSRFAHVLARHAKLAFSEIRHALADLAQVDGVMQGSLTIGTLPYSRTVLAPQAIHRMLTDYPQIDVATREGPYAIMEASLRSGDLDMIVGAVRPSSAEQHIHTEELFQDRLAVIARTDHPLMKCESLAFDDLLELDWVLPPENTPARSLFERMLERKGLAMPGHSVQTSSLSMIRGLLLDSDRVALLSEHQIYYDALYGLMRPLPIVLEDTFRPMGITLRANTEPSPAARKMIENLRAVAANMPATL